MMRSLRARFCSEASAGWPVVLRMLMTNSPGFPSALASDPRFAISESDSPARSARSWTTIEDAFFSLRTFCL